jgi:hypothetical protein
MVPDMSRGEWQVLESWQSPRGDGAMAGFEVLVSARSTSWVAELDGFKMRINSWSWKMFAAPEYCDRGQSIGRKLRDRPTPPFMRGFGD